jgi:hypothetical protein
MFEETPAGVAGRRAALAAALERLPSTRADGERSVLGPDPLSTAVGQVGRGTSEQDMIPVLAPLAGLLPGGVRRGDAVAVASRDQVCDYVTLALLAGALAAGLWCAAVGVPELGGVALADLVVGAGGEADGLDRLLLAPEPGERWAEVVSALADGVDLLLVRPSGPVNTAVGRRVDARLRQGRSTGTKHSAALVVLGPWSSARVMLRTKSTRWTGLDGVGTRRGTGRLTGGLSVIVAEGRATGGRERRVQVWLPAADGTARAAKATGAAVHGSSDAAARALRVVA